MGDLQGYFAHLDRRSTKWDTYFPVYEHLFRPYRGRPITLVEVGVLNGGSLFLWRAFFGEKARIIGVDLNPASRRLEAAGFEIFIGDQADPRFWQAFFASVGPVDILIDDGGHRNDQQIQTVEGALPHIKEGGLLVVEDTHSSYMRTFGNPSRYSFINYAKHQIDRINRRSGKLPMPRKLEERIWGIHFYESLVIFEIYPKRCRRSKEVVQGAESFEAEDFRYHRDESPRLRRLQMAVRPIPFLARQVRSIQKRHRSLVQYLRNRRMKRFFS